MLMNNNGKKTHAVRVNRKLLTIAAFMMAALMLFCTACSSSAGGNSSAVPASSGQNSESSAKPEPSSSTPDKQDSESSDGTQESSEESGEQTPDSPAYNYLNQDACELIGSWMIVGSEGGMSMFHVGDEWHFYVVHGENGDTLYLYDEYFATDAEDRQVSITRVGDGSIYSEELEELYEKDGYYMTFNYELGDASECSPVIWERVFKSSFWVEDKGASPELLKKWYQEDKKDRMTLYMNGYQQRSDEDDKEIKDTVLIFEKILPQFSHPYYDCTSLYGNWVDGDGNHWMLDEDGTIYTDTEGKVYQGGDIYPLPNLTDTGEFQNREHMFLATEREADGSNELIELDIIDISYDGKQVVFFIEDGSTIVLTPVLE